MRAPGSPWRHLITAFLVGRLTAAGAVAVVLVAAACPGDTRAQPPEDQAAQQALTRRVTAVAPASRSLVRAPQLLAPAGRAAPVRRIGYRVRPVPRRLRSGPHVDRRPVSGHIRHAARYHRHRTAVQRHAAGRHVSRTFARRAALRGVRLAAGTSAVVRFAYSQLGRPYVRNGEGRGGWDCSGLTKAAYARVGKRLAHKAARQNGRTVSRRSARPGDLVKWGSYHVGIYVGAGQVIHAPKPGDHVKRSRLWGSYRIVRVR